MVNASVTASEAPPGKIWAIEGLRAWLAWSVVFAHIVQICGIDRTAPGWWITQFIATEAVLVFIIISGFVIANVVLARRESWGRYITRRIFRIFPIYLLLLPIGAATMYLAEAALDHMSWSGDEAFKYDDMARATIASIERAPLAHIGPHLLLLQGVIPDSVLDNSQTSFIGPAWSLSLEWQFYLIAPALVWLISRRAWAAAAVAVLAIGAALYRLGAFGAFELPSIFPAVGYLFALGIASRLIYPVLQRTQFFPVAIAFGCLLIALLYREFLAIALWGAFLSIITGEPRTPHERLASRALSAATHSPFAVAMGARSYAVYLAHWPVIQALAYVLFPLAPFTQWQALVVLGPCAVVTTLLSAEVLRRFVEKPMIRFGAHLASRPRRARLAAAAGEAL